MKNKYSILFIIIILSFSCKKNETSGTISSDNQEAKDSIDSNEINEDIFDAFETAFNRMLNIENNTENIIKTSKLDLISSSNVLKISFFYLNNYFELAEPFRMFYPFINTQKQIEFILSCDEDGKIPLKISFPDQQTFIFGKDYTLLTKRMEESDFLDTFDDNSFYDPNFIGSSHSGYILKTKDKEYLLFLFSYGPWWIHHLFDVTNKNDIKYYILYSIYTTQEGYFMGKDGGLKFKQKYFYLMNSEDKSQDKFRVIDIP